MKLQKLENQINFSHCSLHLFGFVFSIHVVRTASCSAGGTEGALCVEMGFTRTFPWNQDATLK